MPSEESMIEDLREIEAELREKEEYRKANIIDLFIKYSTHCKIPKSNIREKIEELKKYEELAKEQLGNETIIITDSVSLNWGRAEAHYKDIQVLKELLGEEK